MARKPGSLNLRGIGRAIDVERYERALQRVRALAATPDESRATIERAMKEVEP